MNIEFSNLRQAEGIVDELLELKNRIEQRINLKQTSGKKNVLLNNNMVMRICFLTGLSLRAKRDMKAVEAVVLSKNSQRIVPSFFTKNDLGKIYSPLLKLRYADCNVNWEEPATLSRIVAHEILCGRNYLMDSNHLEECLMAQYGSRKATVGIPRLDIAIGTYDGEMEATLDLNGRNVNNTQILIAGSTGSGKTNLLALLVNRLRQETADTNFPVNFLLFDYKGEFSDPKNRNWLNYLEVDETCILDPMQQPLPFTPFRDFTNSNINEVNLYSTALATALTALDNTKISANMANRLSEAIMDAYSQTNYRPISFQRLLNCYQSKLKDPDTMDSISSVLSQIVRGNIFSDRDEAPLVENSFIVKLDSYPKEGVIAKAIVYFLISKINTIYEQLPPQHVTDECVELRHFTIIDEAHYMLGFDNQPLRNLIAVGRNKGMSIILATQSMDSYRSKYFDFYTNAQYPLIMKQQTINDSVLRDLYGLNQREMQELRQDIAALGKGELLIKNQDAYLLGMGKKWKKITVTHLI